MRHAMFVLGLLVAVIGCRTFAPDPSFAAAGSRAYVIPVVDGSPIAVGRDHLVVMREGRLFSVRIGGGRMEPADMLELEPAAGRYAHSDELRLHGDTLIVVRRRGEKGREFVDVARVRVGGDGTLSQIDVHSVPGNRFLTPGSPMMLVGDRIQFYVGMPTEDDRWPESRRARKEARLALRELLDGSTLAEGLDPEPSHVHAVVACDLGGPSLECSTRAILGGDGAEFHVAPDAIYVWTNGSMNRGALVRFGLDGGRPSVLPVSGMPIDADAWTVRDHRVHALVWGCASASASDGSGYGAISAPLTGPVEFVDLPFSRKGGTLQARLVGDTFVYGAGNGSGWVHRDRALEKVRLYARAIEAETEDETRWIDLPHSVEIIDSLGDDALVVGTRGAALHLTTVGLDDTLRVRGRLVMPVPRGEQMATRGLFVAPERTIAGIPMLLGELVGLSVDRVEMVYVGFSGPQPRGLGSVNVPLGPEVRCGKRCGGGPWRPVFHEGRMFAMVRDALVEVAVRGGLLVELDRVDLRVLE